jgi:hypothetical protein
MPGLSKRQLSSRSRGWKKMSPKRGRERNLIMKQCGSSCFLEPKKLAFPICKAHRSRSGRASCKKSCKGLLSAYVRSRQWKHKSTSKKALRLSRKLKCKWLH